MSCTGFFVSTRSSFIGLFYCPGFSSSEHLVHCRHVASEAEEVDEEPESMLAQLSAMISPLISVHCSSLDFTMGVRRLRASYVYLSATDMLLIAASLLSAQVFAPAFLFALSLSRSHSATIRALIGQAFESCAALPESPHL